MAGVLETLKENKNKLLVRVGVVVAGIAGLALVLPIIYSAFLASLGLLGVGITAIIGFGIFSALPMLGQKWENAMLHLRKAEARACAAAFNVIIPVVFTILWIIIV
jgi:hypothetical protein